jgi:hypothetical protein
MTCPKRHLTLALVLTLITVAPAAIAGPHKGVVGRMLPAEPVVISGKLLTYEGQPFGNRQVHFENRVSGDAFLTRTRGDGSFSFPLPPGEYNLRDEQGPIIRSHILAYGEDINLGTVAEPPQIQYLLQREGVAPAQVHSPAPVTSNVHPGTRIPPSGGIPGQAAPN